MGAFRGGFIFNGQFSHTTIADLAQREVGLRRSQARSSAPDHTKPHGNRVKGTSYARPSKI